MVDVSERTDSDMDLLLLDQIRVHAREVGEVMFSAALLVVTDLAELRGKKNFLLLSARC